MIKKKNNNLRNGRRGRNTRNNALYVQDFPNDLISTGDIVPRSMDIKMNFTSEVGTLVSATTFLVRSFRANSLFDPDFLLGGTSFAGYTAISALYREYRVTHCEFEWSLTNLEATGTIVGVVFSTIALTSTVATIQQARDALENGFSTRARLVSPMGGMDKEMLRGKLPLWKLLGNQSEYMSDSSYSSLNNANPVSSLFINCILISTGGVNLTNGVSSAFTLRNTCQWFNRQNNTD